MKNSKKPNRQVMRCLEKMRDATREFVDKTDTLEHRQKIEKSIAESLQQLDTIQLDIKVSVEQDDKDPSAMKVHLTFPDSNVTPYRQLKDAAKKSGLKLTRAKHARGTSNKN